MYLVKATIVSTQAYATPTKIRKNKAPKAIPAQQLANCILYPDPHRSTQKADVVVTQFRVNVNNKRHQVEVFSRNGQITTA